MTAAGDLSKNGRSVALWPNRNQSYDPEIVRSGVTLALVNAFFCSARRIAVCNCKRYRTEFTSDTSVETRAVLRLVWPYL